MKILMLTVDSSLLDGVNRHIYTIAPVLNKMPSLQVAVCSVHKRGELHEALEKAGVTTFSLNVPHGHSLFIFMRFIRVMRSFKPDIVHLHVLALFVRIVLSFVYPHARCIWTVHGTRGGSKGIPSGGMMKTLRRKCYRFLRQHIQIRNLILCYISKGSRRSFEDSGMRCESYVVYNPIAKTMAPCQTGGLQRFLGVGEEVPVIGSACRFAMDKNPTGLARVMCKVLRENPCMHAVILGAGQSEFSKSVLSVVQEYGVQNRFHLPGYCANAAEFIADMQFFVMASYSEGMPTGVLEALVAGVPVAMFEGIGGLEDLVELNAIGPRFLVTASYDDADTLAREVCMVLQDRGKLEKMRMRAKSVADQNFSLASICNTLGNIYKDVYGKKTFSNHTWL